MTTVTDGTSVRAYAFGGPDSQATRTLARAFLNEVKGQRLGTLVSWEIQESYAGNDLIWLVIRAWDFGLVDIALDTVKGE